MRDKQYTVTRNEDGEFFINGKQVEKVEGKNGGYRYVGLLGDLCLKSDLPLDEVRNSDYDRQTLREVDFYDERLKAKHRQNFPRLIDHGEIDGFTWLIQERLDIEDEVIVTDDEMEMVKSIIAEYNLLDIEPEQNETYDEETDEWKYSASWSENYTVIDGVPMFFDFGIYDDWDAASSKFIP